MLKRRHQLNLSLRLPVVENGREQLEVVLEGTSTAEDERAIEAIFAEFGIPTVVMVEIRKADIQVPWLVMISAPLGAFLAVYCAAIAKRLGDDTYDAAKHLVGRLWQARAARWGRNGSVVLKDTDARVRLLLDDGLPKEAYQALEELDREALKRGDTLRYDAVTGEWRPLK